MALRRDQIQSLKDALCLDNVDPATRSALNNLVDNLIPLFESTAIPDLGDLEGINDGSSTGPSNEDDMLGGTPPLGGGEEMPYDELRGFEDAPPGGGDGGGGDPGGGEPDPLCLTEIFPAITTTEIPASSDGSPGEGFVAQMFLAPRAKDEEDDEDPVAAQDIFNCRLKCEQEMGDDLLLSFTPEELEDMDEEERDAAVLAELVKCYAECNKDLSLQKKGGNVPVYNISCEKIEKDKTVIVSYDTCQEHGYVLVEACGCD